MTNTDILKIGVNQKSFPQFLFKYRSDNSFTENIIVKNEMWFSNPLEFNDVYDCNTPINTDTSIEDIKYWLNNVGIYQENIDELAERLKQNPNLAKQKTEEAMAKSGICCFSSLENSILQWSHYSDYHKGICLKFDITEDADFFITPVIVAYRKVMQHYNHFVHQKNLIEYLIQPKFYEWNYESEIRIVKTEVGISKNSGSRVFKFKNIALKEIIFGVKTPENIIKKYMDLCAKNNKSHVNFFKMEIGNGVHYDIIKKPI